MAQDRLDLPSLWDVASRHGLKPQRSGRRLRFFCPWCLDGGRSPRKGRSASGAGDIEAGPWRCWSCDRRGTALQIAAYFGEVDLPGRRERAPERPPRPLPPKATERVAAGWRAVLEATTLDGIERVRAWALRQRHFPDEIAEAISQDDEVAAPLRGDVRKGFGVDLIRFSHRKRRGLLVPIRCHRGTVRSVACRWIGVGPPPANDDGTPGPKSLSLPIGLTGNPDDWGNTWIYGSLPEAVQAAAEDEPIYLVEGAPNYLCTRALLQVSSQPGAVLGFYSAQTALQTARALVQALGEQGTIAPKIVLVPDIDQPRRRRDGTMPAHGVGMEAALACAEVLRGRAGVYLAEIQLDGGRTKDDVADFLGREGIERAATLLRRAICLHPAPFSLHDARVELEQRFRQAVADATVGTSHGGYSLVILRIDPGTGKSWQALRTAAQAARGDVPLPLCSRRPKHVPKEAWPPKERSVAFFTPDHSMATEKVQELEHLVPGTPSRQIHGLLHHCSFKKHVDDVFQSVGRQGVCGRPGDEEQRCHLADTCAGAQEPAANRGEVTFAPHALLGHMKADLVIIDESPGVVARLDEPKRKDARGERDRTGISDETIASLYTCRLMPSVRAWRQVRNPQAGDAASLLAKVVGPLAAEHARRVSAGDVDSFARRITGQDLVELVRGVEGLEAMLREGYIERRQAAPPVPSPSDARAGVHNARSMPSRLAWRAMRELAEYVKRLTDPPDEDDPLRIVGEGAPAGEGTAAEGPQPQAAIRLDTDGRWGIDVLSVASLPKSPIVLLDATGDLTLEEYRAAYPDRRIVMRELDVQGAAPAVAVHIDSSSFSRRRLIGPNKAPTDGAVDHVRNVLRVLVDRIRGVYPSLGGARRPRLAILTYKALADAMNGCGPAAQAETSVDLQRAVADLGRLGVDVHDAAGTSMIGYYGLHDRGQNAWQDVDALAVIGDPIENLGETSFEAAFLGLEGDVVSVKRTAATCRQAIARARHMQRDGDRRVVLLFAGRTPPDIRGVVWREEALPSGAIPSAAAQDLVALLLYIARHEHHVVGRMPLEVFDRAGTPWAAIDLAGLSTGTIKRAVKRVATDLRLRPFEVGIGGRSGPVVLYAPALDAVSLWADRHNLALQ